MEGEIGRGAFPLGWTVQEEDPSIVYPAASRLFAVVSWGCAATTWVARALNSHPDIMCVHDLNVQLQTLFGGKRLDGVPYLRLVDRSSEGYLLAGCVNAFDRRHVESVFEHYGDRFRVAVLVRNPEDRLLSQYALFDQFWTTHHWQGLDYLNSIGYEASGHPEEDYRRRLRFHGANMLNAIIDEWSVGPVFRSEDLTTKPQTLARLVDHLSGSSMRVKSRWARSQVRRPHTHSHRAGRREELTADERRIVRKIVKEDAWARYQELGYRLPTWL